MLVSYLSTMQPTSWRIRQLIGFYSSFVSLFVCPCTFVVLLLTNTVESTTTTATNTGSSSICTTNTTQNVDILIVGAGISGLSAYREIKRLAPRQNVVIIEATNRIGGRMKKGFLAKSNITIELGSNWLESSDTAFSNLAMASQLQYSKTNFLRLNVFNETTGRDITSQYYTAYQQFTNAKTGPYYKMLLAAKQYWNEINRVYNGTENIMTLMKTKFAYIEDTELKAFIRWLLIDYEYTFNDVALLNFYSPYEDMIDPNEYEKFIIDQRGFESVLQKFVTDHTIQPTFNTRVTDIIYANHPEIDSTYKVIVQTRPTTPTTNNGGTSCTKYKAKRVIVTVPVSVLRGSGYGINFQPKLNISTLPMYTGQYNKVFFKFQNNFWGNSDAYHQFIGIIRPNQYRDVCTHWQNVNYNIPNSYVLMCTLTDSEPLRKVYGTTTVNNAYEEVLMARWDLEPAAGYGAYSSYKAGFTLDQYYSFWGGRSNKGFTKGEGYNNNNEWVVHVSGSASCFEYYELVDGAYYSGIRSARNVLKSFGSTYGWVSSVTACEDF